MSILTHRRVSNVFGDADNGAALITAVDDVSLEVQDGEFYSIIDPSGWGKSTLVRIVAGLFPVIRGHLTNNLTYT